MAQIEDDAVELLTQRDPHEELPGRAGGGCASTARSGTARCSSPARSTSPSTALRPLFDEIVAAEMTVRPDGTLSGEMVQVPPTGETRAQILPDYCAAEGLRLDESVAYADSTSDLPLLEAVGFPVAVNPETRLAAIARKRGWLVEHWSKAERRPPPAAAVRPADGRARAPPEVRVTPDPTRSDVQPRHPRRTLRWERREGAAGQAVGRPAGAGAGGVGARRRRRPCGSGRSSTRRSTSPTAPARAGTACTPGWPGSAAATCR